MIDLEKLAMNAVEELERLAKAATPGPWMSTQSNVGEAVQVTARPIVGAQYVAEGIFLKRDAAYIAAANPQAILELLRHIREKA